MRLDANRVTDIWFRSESSLRDIAAGLELLEIVEDAENYWEWIIGLVGSVRVDLTRTHTLPNGESDARLFLLDGGEFSEAQVLELVGRLRTFVSGEISCGRWEYRAGNDFDRIVVKTFDSSGRHLGVHTEPLR
jgi:hypothetical protein